MTENTQVATANPIANALTEMYGPMATIDNVKSLLKAFVAASKTFEAVEKGRTNPHLKNKYSDLGDVLDATKEALLENGLIIVQDPISFPDGEAKMVVRSRLIHEDGAMLMNEVGLPLAANANAQSVGSAITYGRRYGLKALLGVQDSDDDAQGASRRPAQAGAANAAPSAVGNDAPATEAQIGMANKLREELGVKTPLPKSRVEMTNHIRDLQAQKAKAGEQTEAKAEAAPEKSEEAKAEVKLGVEATKLLALIKSKGGVTDESKLKASLADLVKTKKITQVEADEVQRIAPKAEAAKAEATA